MDQKYKLPKIRLHKNGLPQINFDKYVLCVLFRFAPQNLGLNMGWGDDMSNSVEFKPLTKLSR